MNNTFLATLLALLAVILVTLLTVSLLDEDPESETAAEAPEEAHLSEAESSRADSCLLGVYEGRLALFLNGSAYPQKVYEVWVHQLPEADRALLESGIEVSGREELARLIEDYTS